MSDTIYIPGLGDGRLFGVQRKFVSGLNKFQSAAGPIDFFDPRWQTNEPYDDKFARLLETRPRQIFASSAGCSLAVRLAAELDGVEAVHLFCGKITGAEKIGPERRAQAPAFLESTQCCEALVKEGLEASRYTCYIPKGENDGVLETADMLVTGAKVVELPHLNHALAIGYALVRYMLVSRP